MRITSSRPALAPTTVPAPTVARSANGLPANVFESAAPSTLARRAGPTPTPMPPQGSVPATGSYPSPEQAAAIAAIKDPVQRNYAITQGYSDLGYAMSALIGSDNCNWCAFATWASRQAGVSIRQEDLPVLEKALHAASGPAAALQKVNDLLRKFGIPGLPGLPELIQGANGTLDQMSRSLGDGNQLIFGEMGPAFAHFIDTFKGDTHYDQAKVDQYLAGFPPDQALLKDAFAHYAKAMFETDPKAKAEEILLANDDIGLEEQTRVQPDIDQALNAPAPMFKAVLKDAVDAAIDTLPFGVKQLARLAVEKSGLLDKVLTPVVNELDKAYRGAATGLMMKLALPNQTLRLGKDVPNLPGSDQPYPEQLRQISDPKLAAMIAQIDRNPDSTKGSAAHDWSSLSDRMQYVGEFFRSRQQTQALFDAPFGQRGTYATAKVA